MLKAQRRPNSGRRRASPPGRRLRGYTPVFALFALVLTLVVALGPSAFASVHGFLPAGVGDPEGIVNGAAGPRGIGGHGWGSDGADGAGKRSGGGREVSEDARAADASRLPGGSSRRLDPGGGRAADAAGGAEDGAASVRSGPSATASRGLGDPHSAESTGLGEALAARMARARPGSGPPLRALPKISDMKVSRAESIKRGEKVKSKKKGKKKAQEKSGGEKRGNGGEAYPAANVEGREGGDGGEALPATSVKGREGGAGSRGDAGGSSLGAPPAYLRAPGTLRASGGALSPDALPFATLDATPLGGPEALSSGVGEAEARPAPAGTVSLAALPTLTPDAFPVGLPPLTPDASPEAFPTLDADGAAAPFFDPLEADGAREGASAADAGATPASSSDPSSSPPTIKAPAPRPRGKLLKPIRPAMPLPPPGVCKRPPGTRWREQQEPPGWVDEAFAGGMRGVAKLEMAAGGRPGAHDAAGADTGEEGEGDEEELGAAEAGSDVGGAGVGEAGSDVGGAGVGEAGAGGAGAGGAGSARAETSDLSAASELSATTNSSAGAFSLSVEHHYATFPSGASSSLLPLLHEQLRLVSASPRRPESSVTIVTQLSLERLAMLRNQCAAWPDRIAAAVYVPLYRGRVMSTDDAELNGTTLDRALDRVRDVFDWAEAGERGEVPDDDPGARGEGEWWREGAWRDEREDRRKAHLEASRWGAADARGDDEAPRLAAVTPGGQVREETLLEEARRAGAAGRALAPGAPGEGGDGRGGDAAAPLDGAAPPGASPRSPSASPSASATPASERKRRKKKKKKSSGPRLRFRSRGTEAQNAAAFDERAGHAWWSRRRRSLLEAEAEAEALLPELLADEASLASSSGSAFSFASVGARSLYSDEAYSSARCALDVTVVAIEYASVADASLYPYNAVRNRALALAETDAVVLLDVDFVPSGLVAERWRADVRARRAALRAMRNDSVAFVLPAFQTDGADVANVDLPLELARGGTAAVARAFGAGRISGFQMSGYYAGHGPTDHERWARIALGQGNVATPPPPAPPPAKKKKKKGAKAKADAAAKDIATAAEETGDARASETAKTSGAAGDAQGAVSRRSMLAAEAGEPGRGPSRGLLGELADSSGSSGRRDEVLEGLRSLLRSSWGGRGRQAAGGNAVGVLGGSSPGAPGSLASPTSPARRALLESSSPSSSSPPPWHAHSPSSPHHAHGHHHRSSPSWRHVRSLFVSPTPGGFADGAYAIAPSQGYEPYFLILRSRVPWYDERFRGYGRDKIVHVAHVIAEGTRFFALPEGFAVHVPHPRTVTFKATKDLGQWDKLKTLYMNVLKELKRGTFVPMTTLRQGLCTNDAL